MAADSRSGRGAWTMPGIAEKLFRMADGGVAAVTGDCAPGCRYIEWLDVPGDRPEPDIGDATVVRLMPDGTIRVYEAGGSYIENVAEFLAWGSGMAPALGAMHMGADAVKAVEIAALVDAHTGGPVVSMKIKKEDR